MIAPADLVGLTGMHRTNGTGAAIDERVDWFFECRRWRAPRAAGARQGRGPALVPARRAASTGRAARARRAGRARPRVGAGRHDVRVLTGRSLPDDPALRRGRVSEVGRSVGPARRMKFGVTASCGSAAQSIEMAVAAEEAGWDGFFAWDGISVGADGHVRPVDAARRGRGADQPDHARRDGVLAAAAQAVGGGPAGSDGRPPLRRPAGAARSGSERSRTAGTAACPASTSTSRSGQRCSTTRWRSSTSRGPGEPFSYAGDPPPGHRPGVPAPARARAHPRVGDRLVVRAAVHAAGRRPRRRAARPAGGRVRPARPGPAARGAAPGCPSSAEANRSSWSSRACCRPTPRRPGTARPSSRTPGVTWWIHSDWDFSTVTPDGLLDRIRLGPVPA